MLNVCVSIYIYICIYLLKCLCVYIYIYFFAMQTAEFLLLRALKWPNLFLMTYISCYMISCTFTWDKYLSRMTEETSRILKIKWKKLLKDQTKESKWIKKIKMKIRCYYSLISGGGSGWLRDLNDCGDVNIAAAWEKVFGDYENMIQVSRRNEIRENLKSRFLVFISIFHFFFFFTFYLNSKPLTFFF